MFAFFRRLFARIVRRLQQMLAARETPPSDLPGDPPAGVREPRVIAPRGRSSAAAVPEPEEAQLADAIAQR